MGLVGSGGGGEIKILLFCGDKSFFVFVCFLFSCYVCVCVCVSRKHTYIVLTPLNPTFI